MRNERKDFKMFIVLDIVTMKGNTKIIKQFTILVENKTYYAVCLKTFLKFRGKTHKLNKY